MSISEAVIQTNNDKEIENFHASSFSNSGNVHSPNSNSPTKLKVYKQRWGVLFAGVLFNISNASLWICYSAASTTVANFFEKDVEKINWFSLLFLIFAIPGAFYGPYCVDRWGLKPVLWMGGSLNLVGALIKAIGTSNLISDPGAQYGISLSGQFFCALAQNFVLYLHTKVSQTWFSEDQRGIATTILSMSNPLGIVIAEVSVPFIISSESDVPLNDKIWLGVATLSAVFTFVFVRRSCPKTSPSHSFSASKKQRPSFGQQLKMAFTTGPFLLLILSLGGGIALTIAFATLTQQITCPLGYSEEFAGLINGIMLLSGFVGAVFAGILLDKTKMYTEITMYLFGAGAFVGIILFEFLLVPHREILIGIFAALFGLFGVALFPVGLELAVETTFPVEESITVALIFLSGQIIGILIVVIVPILARDKKSELYLSVCNLDADIVPKDYTVSLLVVMVFLGLVCCLPIAFFKTEYKRQKAEHEQERSRSITSLDETFQNV